MERKFCINWSAIVCEAKQRRKKQKLTQQQLADLAGVSTPTISRFENNEKDIQLSSILNILGILGMNDERRLEFPDPEPVIITGRSVVRFYGSDGDKKITCEISREALEDFYQANWSDGIKIFNDNRLFVEQEARRKYLSGMFESDGNILIKSSDL